MIREITIKAILNGYIVQIGCQTLVFNDLNTMMLEISRYFENPEKTEKFYLETSINAGKLAPQLTSVSPAGRNPPTSEQPSMQPQTTR